VLSDGGGRREDVGQSLVVVPTSQRDHLSQNGRPGTGSDLHRFTATTHLDHPVPSLPDK
jgi:hypothetical protein